MFVSNDVLTYCIKLSLHDDTAAQSLDSLGFLESELSDRISSSSPHPFPLARQVNRESHCLVHTTLHFHPRLHLHLYTTAARATPPPYSSIAVPAQSPSALEIQRLLVKRSAILPPSGSLFDCAWCPSCENERLERSWWNCDRLRGRFRLVLVVVVWFWNELLESVVGSAGMEL